MPNSTQNDNRNSSSRTIELFDLQTFLIANKRHINIIEVGRIHKLDAPTVLSLITALREFRRKDGQHDTIKILDNHMYLTDTAYHALCQQFPALFPHTIAQEAVLKALGHFMDG